MYFCSDLFGEQVPCYLVIWPPNYFFATTMYENLRVPVRVAGEICDFLAIKRVDLGDVPHYGSSKGARSQHFQSGELGCSAPSWVTTFNARDRLNTWNRSAERPGTRSVTGETLPRHYHNDLAPPKGPLRGEMPTQEALGAR